MAILKTSGRSAAGAAGVTVESAPLHILDELVGVLSKVCDRQISEAAQLLEDRRRRWFLCGQGRSGLVAAMAAMRLMHVGFITYVVGEATTPAVVGGDGLVAISATGETPLTLHFARPAQGLGGSVLAVTGRADSTLANIAETVLELPTSGSDQFGGTLFGQSALLVLDALVLTTTAGDAQAHTVMRTRHANLQ